MADAARRILIQNNSELGRQLAEAGESGLPVVLEVNGHAYRLTLQSPTHDDPWSNYDPETARKALAESAGALKGDREQFLRDIHQAWSQDSHGRPA